LKCDQALGTSDAICECNDYFSPTGACKPKLWPDKDHGLVCGACKVLVNHFSSKYKTCTGYCKSIGAKCTGAWEEKGDKCTVESTLKCDQALGTSDAICECKR